MPAKPSPRAGTAAGIDPAGLWEQIAPTPGKRVHCAVAWSGGLDSTVLLHLMTLLRARHPRQLVLRALHVDHHLQAASVQFRAHCRRLARRWRVPLRVLDVSVAAAAGESLEAVAREARYGALQSVLAPGEVLLTAQHADDQLETLLLALLRGAGPAGLAAMPRTANLGGAQLLRPLLELPRSALVEHAGVHDLQWVEDPSNQLQRFDRNYLRAEVVPLLLQRWPGALQTVARSARHCAAVTQVLAGVTALDLQAAADGAGLDMRVLRRWPAARQLDTLRAWFRTAGLRSPDTRHLQQIRSMLQSRPDAHPVLELAGVSIRAHEPRLVMDCQPQTQPQGAASEAPPWRWSRALVLPQGQISVRRDAHGDLDLDRLPGVLLVHFPATAPGRGRSLRKLLQELAVPAWERSRLPLLCSTAGELLAVADLWLRPDVQARAQSRRRGRIVWRPQR